MQAGEAPRARTEADQCALVARQPIYGTSMTVTAYELLYAQLPGVTPARTPSVSDATLRVLADAALEIGLDRLAGDLPVHINFPRALVLDPSALVLEPERVVIEVVEDLPNDPALIEGVRRLRSRGHHIAIENYSGRFNNPGLLDLADIVKIDVSQETPASLGLIAPVLIRRGLKLIAEQVETIEQFEQCHQAGFECFQGDFLERPQTFLAQRVPTNRLATLRLIAALQNEQFSVEEVEALVSQDVAMSYRVLRCINSSYYSLPRKVESIRQAIVMLGLEALRQLCTLVALQGFDDRPPSLFVTAMARARMCEQLARLAGVRDTGPYFITGLFSLLDVLTGVATAQLLDELPLAENVERALLAQEGDLGCALKCARAYERASWERVNYGGLAPALIRAAYVDAVFWAEKTQALMAQ